jgi:cysteinyl-tRNA synthetase
MQESPEAFLQAGLKEESVQIQALVNERFAARKNKDWAKSDEIRAQLLELGVEVEDSPEGTVWRVK